MPLFEYRCEDCDALLEVFLQPNDPAPRLCGPRCALGPGDPRADLRGGGQLTRQLSAPGATLRTVLVGDRPTDAEIARSGFTVYHNEGGRLVRTRGEQGPKVVREDD